MICLYQREEALFLAGRRPGEVILVQVWTSRNDNDKIALAMSATGLQPPSAIASMRPWKRKDYGGFYCYPVTERPG
jgi:hypothetical protein